MLINKLQRNDVICENPNFLLLSDDSSGIDGTRFYTLNGAASVAYGDQRRLILTEDSYELLYDREQKEICVNSKRMLMNEYDTSNNKLDGVIVYNCDIGYKKCVLLKIWEMIDAEVYQKQIEKMGEWTC